MLTLLIVLIALADVLWRRNLMSWLTEYRQVPMPTDRRRDHVSVV
jgi:type II secretory pathway component PulC